MKNYRAVAVELIAYQTDGFADKLIQAFADLHAIADPTEAQRSEPCKRIVKMTKERFGLKIALTVDTDMPPACVPLIGHTNHALFTPQLLKEWVPDADQSIERAIMEKPAFKGTIDFKRARVGGDYTGFEAPVFMGQNFCRGLFTPGESAAAFIHEIGHCFLAFEFMFRTARCSQLLASLHQVKTGRSTEVSYTYAVKKVATKLHEEGILTSPHEFEDLVELKEDAAIVSVAYARTWRKLATDFGSSAATGPNFETLADNFAVKFGLGPELASSLQKMGDSGIDDTGMSITLSYIATALSPLALGVLPYSLLIATGSTIVGATVVGAIFAAVVATLYLCMGGHSLTNAVFNPYGKDMTRLNRIREATIGFLKVGDLTPQARAHLMNQIKTIDKFISGRTDTVNFWDDLANLVFTDRRNADRALKLERDIELLTSNNLFIGASALKQLA